MEQEQEQSRPVPQEIDYSAIVPEASDPAASEWEPPAAVFFGKRLPGGKKEKLPVYVHQSFPCMLYGLIEGRVRAVIANNEGEKDRYVARGYHDSPAAFGIETTPASEEAAKRRLAAELATLEVETETVQIVKRKPGRPRKAA